MSLIMNNHLEVDIMDCTYKNNTMYMPINMLNIEIQNYLHICNIHKTDTVVQIYNNGNYILIHYRNNDEIKCRIDISL